MDKPKAVNALRVLSCDMINKANSGHPGIALGAAPIVYALFDKYIKGNPKDLSWHNRDRFILSAGHGSSLLYSLLHLTGVLSLDDVKNFRQPGKTPGHPELHDTPGVEVTTGPLGQGVAMAVGLAMGFKHLAATFNKEDIKLFDNKVYVLCGDGDLQEGISYEALSLAGHYNLDNLVLLYDSNDIQLDGKVSDAFSEDIKKRFESQNFEYHKVANGDDSNEIKKVLNEIKNSKKPIIVEIKTKIGFGSSNENSHKVHGSPLGDDINTLRKNLNWDYKPFDIPKEIYNHFKEIYKDYNTETYNKSIKDLKDYEVKYPEDFKKFKDYKKGKISFKVNDYLKLLNTERNTATRNSSGEILKKLTKENTNLIGGSADLSSSTKVIANSEKFSKDNYLGRNITFGVREHAMGAIANGLALTGFLRPFVSGFFVFSDYLKPAIRMSALMKLPVLYLFTHDSIYVGEDGPTHQPIEQIDGLRSIPSLKLYRPANKYEVIKSYELALNNLKEPSIILLTRQNLKDYSESERILKSKDFSGAYTIFDTDPYKNHDLVVYATGSEVELAVEAAKEISDSYNIRVESVLELETFLNSGNIAHSGKNSLAVEASSGYSLYKLTRNVYSINRFGLSAPADVVCEQLKFTKRDLIKYFFKVISGDN